MIDCYRGNKKAAKYLSSPLPLQHVERKGDHVYRNAAAIILFPEISALNRGNLRLDYLIGYWLNSLTDMIHDKDFDAAYVFWPLDAAPEPLLSTAKANAPKGYEVGGVIIGHDREWLKFLGVSLSASDYVLVTIEWQGEKYEMCILCNEERSADAE